MPDEAGLGAPAGGGGGAFRRENSDIRFGSAEEFFEPVFGPLDGTAGQQAQQQQQQQQQPPPRRKKRQQQQPLKPEDFPHRPVNCRFGTCMGGKANMANSESIPINPEQPVPFETSLFKGRMAICIRGAPGSSTDPWAAGSRFEGKRRKVVLTVQGEFKRRISRSEVQVGMMWKNGLSNLPWSFVLNAAENVILAFSPGATSTLSSPTRASFMNSLLAGVDSLHVSDGKSDRFDMMSAITPESSEWPTPKKRMDAVKKLGEKLRDLEKKAKKEAGNAPAAPPPPPAAAPSPAEGADGGETGGYANTVPQLKRQRTTSETTRLLSGEEKAVSSSLVDEGLLADWGYYEPGKEYTFDFYGDKIDLVKFAAFIPTLPEINLNKYFNGQPFPFIAMTKSGEVLWHFEVWHEMQFDPANSTHSPSQCGLAPGSVSAYSDSESLRDEVDPFAVTQNTHNTPMDVWSCASGMQDQPHHGSLPYGSRTSRGYSGMNRQLSFQSCVTAVTDGQRHPQQPHQHSCCLHGTHHHGHPHHHHPQRGGNSQDRLTSDDMSAEAHRTYGHTPMSYPKSPCYRPTHRSSQALLSCSDGEDLLEPQYSMAYGASSDSHQATMVYHGGDPCLSLSQMEAADGTLRGPSGGGGPGGGGGKPGAKRGILKYKAPNLQLRTRWNSWDEHLGGASQPRPTDYFCAALLAVVGVAFFILCIIWYQDVVGQRIKSSTITIKPSAVDCIKVIGIALGTLVVGFLIGALTEFLKVPYLREASSPAAKKSRLLGLNIADSTFVAIAMLLAVPEELCFRAIIIPTREEQPDNHARFLWSVLSLVLYVGHFPLLASTVFPRGYPTFVDPRFLAITACVGTGCCLAYAEVPAVWSAAVVNAVCFFFWLVVGGGLRRLRKVRITLPRPVSRGGAALQGGGSPQLDVVSEQSYTGSMHTAPSERYPPFSEPESQCSAMTQTLTGSN